MNNDNLPILDGDTLKCSSCDRFFSESDIIRHCVEEHPDSLVARVVALAREDETA